MKLEILRNNAKGFDLYLDGTEMSYLEASRMLTGTNCERMHGVFNGSDGPEEFYRDGKSVMVDLTDHYNADTDPKDLEVLVLSRAIQVWQAFADLEGL